MKVIHITTTKYASERQIVISGSISYLDPNPAQFRRE